MGGCTRLGNNEINILVNDMEKDGDINTQEALQIPEVHHFSN